MEPFAPVFIAFDYIYMYIIILAKRHVFVEILCDHLEYSSSFIFFLKQSSSDVVKRPNGSDRVSKLFCWSHKLILPETPPEKYLRRNATRSKEIKSILTATKVAPLPKQTNGLIRFRFYVNDLVLGTIQFSQGNERCFAKTVRKTISVTTFLWRVHS